MINNQYYGKDDATIVDVTSGFRFDEKVLQQALERLYNREVKTEDNEIDGGLWEETTRIFDKATSEGFSQSKQSPSKDFTEKVKENNGIYSAFRVHAMQEKMAELLYDEDGELVSYDEWMQLVKPISTHFNKTWLQTEYDTAVQRAKVASDWDYFRSVADVLPNVEWMPTTSINPGADHKIFWHTILPQNHPFWNFHRPGDRWNCKCSLEATDDTPSPAPDGFQDIELPSPGLDGRMEDTQQVFSDKSPFFPTDCGDCSFNIDLSNGLKKVFNKRKKDCYNCQLFAKCVPSKEEK